LAAAEEIGASGPEFLEAVAAGYEIAIRIGEAVGKRHYFFFQNTSTCGVFGAAASAGWLFQLDQEEFVWALGNAGTQAAGLWQFNREGAMSKHLHAGMAAANGLRAASLAKLKFSGSPTILEGDQGFFAATAPDASPEVVVRNLGDSELKIKNVSIKPYASCRHTHPAIDTALAIRDKTEWELIDRCHLDTYQAALDLCDNPDPQTPYAAKFSLQYCVSSALVRGRVGLADFTTESLFNNEIRQLMPRIALSLDKEFERAYPRSWAARLSLTQEDGTSLREQVRHPKGDPENPLSDVELKAKFRQLAAFGGHAQNVDSWLEWVDSLQNEQPVAVPDLRSTST
jgi:2-methylcitrate dehydratase PrpD